jgi:hypothetical protein
VAGKNSHFKLVQNGLAEKFKPMLKNRCLAMSLQYVTPLQFLIAYFEKTGGFISFGATKVAK